MNWRHSFSTSVRAQLMRVSEEADKPPRIVEKRHHLGLSVRPAKARQSRLPSIPTVAEADTCLSILQSNHGHS